jgi:hypothetical protein
VSESVVLNSSGAGGTSTNDSLVSTKIAGLDWHTVTIGVSRRKLTFVGRADRPAHNYFRTHQRASRVVAGLSAGRGLRSAPFSYPDI